MNPDALALFRDVADLSPSDRAAYYEAHRVTQALRAEVESLLRFDPKTDDPFRKHVAAAAEQVLVGPGVTVLRDATAPAVATRDEPGTWFGPYRLRELLGEGGMGVVWLADQEQPIRRTVAIKVVKLGADSTRILSRFESERQALAILNHPHVAKVFDAGSTRDGRPYFVMEYVAGRPITAFADDHCLSIRERLELFLQVCDAVQHAHQKGLLHRDLKPGNILVADQDGRAVAKVIDFGIAKAIGPQLTEQTLATEFGVLVGTPEYMSPEQAGFLDENVDTRTDIYTLGLVLYELLVGAAPFQARELGRYAVLEVLRIIREQDPPRLTERLTNQADAAVFEIARRRRTEPQTLARLLHHDLEWITARAIEKEPSRRYPSASELAADVRRHLESEPVLAGPPDVLYRLGKLARKHRAGAFAATAALVIVLAASIVSTMFWLRSERARGETRRQLVSRQVAEGMRLVDDNNHVAALPWLAQALTVEPDGAVAEDAHRRRLGMVLDRVPALANVWAFDADVVHSDLSPDRRWVALATSDGLPRVVDLENGAVTRAREGHAGRINHIKFSKDGRWLATAGSDGSARVWSRTLDAAGPPLRHDGEVLAADISPDGQVIATIGHGDVVRVWDVPSGAVRFTLPHSGPVMALVFSPDGRLIASGSGNAVTLWEAATGTRAREDLHHSRPITLLEFSPDGTVLAVGANHLLRVWNVAAGQPLGDEVAQVNPIYDFDFAPDRRWIAWGSSGHILGILDARTGAPARPMITRRDQVFNVTFSPDGRHLASLELGGFVQVWRTADWQPEELSVSGGPKARAVFFGASGRHLAVLGERSMLLWDLAAASPSHPTMSHTGFLRSLALSGDGSRMLATVGALGSLENYARVWAPDQAEPVTPPLREGGFVSAIFDKTGSRVATGGRNGRIQVWDARTGEPIGSPMMHDSFVGALAFSPDGQSLATGGGEGYAEQRPGRRGDLHMWDLASGRRRWSAQLASEVYAVTFTPDGTSVIAGTAAGEVAIWDAATGHSLGSDVHHHSPVHAVIVSSDGRWTAAIGQRGIHLRDHATGATRWLSTQTSFRGSFDPQNQRLIAGTFDGEVNVWDLLTGQPVAARMKPGGLVYSTFFDRNGRYLVTASVNGSARVWDAAGRPLSPALRLEGAASWSGHFAPDNRTVISVGGRSARVWDFRLESGEPAELTGLAELLAGYQLDASASPVPLSPQDLRRRFEELSKGHPAWFSVMPQKEAQWKRSSALWAWRMGRPSDAASQLERVLELEATRSLTWAQRGRVRAEAALWQGAIADFERAVALRPDEAEYYRDLALARLGAGDDEGFRRECGAIKRRFGTTRNPDRAQWIARTCALLPPVAGEDVSWLVQAAERWRDVEPDGVHQLGTLGAALLRARREEAEATLQRALQAAGAKADPWAAAFLEIVRAGRTQRDRRGAASEPTPAAGAQPMSATETWRERLEMEVLTREVRTLVKP
jgi:WD40 repeat protein/serine/threonine protein kinase/tetratricopeptide (TPR) repeat protein